MLLSSRAEESAASLPVSRRPDGDGMDGVRTQGGTVSDDGLVDLTVVDDNVGIADGTRGDEVDWVRGEVRVCEETRSIPRRRPLRAGRRAGHKSTQKAGSQQWALVQDRRRTSRTSNGEAGVRTMS